MNIIEIDKFIVALYYESMIIPKILFILSCGFLAATPVAEPCSNNKHSIKKNTDDLFPESNPIFISLGNNCWTAQALVLAGLRECAFPFDWLFSKDDEGLIQVFDEDFAYFTDRNYFFPHEYDRVSVINNRYGLIFTHEWPFSDLEMSEERHEQHLEVIKVKYDRRINRFRKLREYKGKVFFFRTFSTDPNIFGIMGWNTEKARRLKESLDRYFPNLDFTLVILSCSIVNIPEIDAIDGVIEFKIKELFIHANYLEMFRQLKGD